MKKLMQTRFGKRLPLALLLLAAAVVFGILLQNLSGKDATLWQRSGWLFGTFGTGMAALFFFLLGWRGLLGGYALILLILLRSVLPKPWNRYFSLAYLLLLLTLPSLKKQWMKRKGKAGKAEESIPEELPEDEAADAPDGGILLVQFSVSDRLYQLVRRPGQIIAYRIGGELRGVDESLVQDPQKPLRPVGKKDLIFPVDETLRVQIFDRYNNRLDKQTVDVKLKSGRHRHMISALNGDEQLRAFFSACVPNSTVKKTEPPKETCGAANPKRVALLRKVNIGLCIFAGAVYLPWLFLNVPYRLFAVLALIPFPITLGLCCAFPDDTTVSEEKRAERTRASFLPVLMAGAIVPPLRVLYDFNFLAWERLLLISTGVLVLLMMLALCFTKEWRGRKRWMPLLLLLPFAFYAFGATALLNYLPDSTEPNEQSAVVEKMRIDKNSESPDRYNLTVRMPDGATETLEVGEEFYTQTAIGDTVTVETYCGAFDIPYAFVR